MKKIIFGLALLTATSLCAQIGRDERFLEVGVTAAATNYSGDLAEKLIVVPQTRAGGGLFVRYNLNRFLQVRGQLFLGQLYGDDKHSPNHSGRQFRFTSTLLENSLLLEGVLANIKFDAVNSNTTFYFFPYVVAGIGVARAKPKVTYYGPESDRERFVKVPIPEGGTQARSALAVPLGLGIRMISSDWISLSVEGLLRPGISDLLDGVSQNGNPDKNDWYYSLGINVGYFINGPWRPSRRDR